MTGPMGGPMSGEAAGRSLCVFSSSSDGIDSRYLDLAAELGAAICGRGIDLVSGGGNVSTMGVLARAVRAGGRHTTGVIPEALVGWEVADNDADELLVTADMRERKGIMDARSDAFLALPGGLGTLEELLEAWVGRILGMHRKPVVILDPWDDFAPLRDLVAGLTAQRMISLQSAADVSWVSTVGEALDAVESGWAAGEGRCAAAPPSPAGRPADWLESD